MSARRPNKGNPPPPPPPPRGVPPDLPPAGGRRTPRSVPSGPPKSAGRRSRRPDQVTKDAHREIGHIHRGLRTLRMLLIVDAVTLGLMFLLAGPASFLGIILGVMFVGAVLGAILVVDQPYPWCIFLAIGHSGLAALMLLVPGTMAYIATGIALLMWWAVGQAATARKLIRQNPDAWAKGSRTYTGRRTDDIGSKFQDRARADQKKRTQKLLLMVGLPLVLLIGAFIVFASGGNSPKEHTAFVPKPIAKPTTPVNARAMAFQSDWNASSLDTIGPMIAASERTKIMRLLRKVIRRREWSDAFPRATPPDLQRHDAAHWYAWHTLEDYGSLRVSWEWSDGAWWVVRLKFKKGS